MKYKTTKRQYLFNQLVFGIFMLSIGIITILSISTEAMADYTIHEVKTPHNANSSLTVEDRIRLVAKEANFKWPDLTLEMI
jgi:hypothetical protein